MKMQKIVGLACVCSMIYVTPTFAKPDGKNGGGGVADSCATFWDDYPNAQPVTISFPDQNDSTTSSYQVALVEHNGTTWTYGFCEQGGKNLSHWTLSIPSCVTSSSDHHISSYDPTSGGNIESVDIGPDSSINNVTDGDDLVGIKWNTGEGFSSGLFTIELDDNYVEGTVTVAAKAGKPGVNNEGRYGFDTATLAGPNCSGLAGGGNNGMAVTLNNFIVTTLTNRTLLEWETGTENNSLGIYLWRAEPINTASTCSSTNSADYVSGSIKALTLVNSYGDATSGQRYFHVDYDVTAGMTYCYLLVEVESDSNLVLHSNDMVKAVAQ